MYRNLEGFSSLKEEVTHLDNISAIGIVENSRNGFKNKVNTLMQQRPKKPILRIIK